MAFATTSAFIQEKNKLHTSSAWVELWELRLNATQVANLTGHTAAVVFGGITYSPFPISRAEFTTDNEGNLIDTTVAVSNVDRAAQVLLDADYFRGYTAIWRLTNTALIADSAAVITERFRIGAVDLDPIWVTFHLGHVNLIDVGFPGSRFLRSRCRWVYGSTDCGYDTTRSGAIATCDKTLNGANGCTFHGDEEVTNGKTRRHPLRYGGCPGIPRGPYL